MRIVRVGTGEAVALTANDGMVLRSELSGPCVAIIVRNPHRGITGMVHAALPSSVRHPDSGLPLEPTYFVDLGVRYLFDEIQAMAPCEVPTAALVVALVGGARQVSELDGFCIGKRNVLAARQALWKIGLGAQHEDVGGDHSRTVSVDVASGTVTISNGDNTQWVLQ